jgi:hypothetical protein
MSVRRFIHLLGLLAALAACSPAGSTTTAEKPGTIQLNQGPSSDIPPGGGGRGTLFFQNTLYSFTISGLGVDGSAVAIIQTTGQVYRLQDVSMFAGTYRKVPEGVELPAAAGNDLWLQNEHHTLMRLAAPPQGRLPNIDDDAVRVVMD